MSQCNDKVIGCTRRNKDGNRSRDPHRRRKNSFRKGIHGKMGPYNIQSDSCQIFHDIMPIGNEHTEGDIQGILSARSGKESKEGGHIVRDFQQFGKVCNHLCKWGR